VISVEISDGAIAELQQRLETLAPRVVARLQPALKPLLASALTSTLNKYFAGSGPARGAATTLLTSRSGNLFSSVVNSLQVSIQGPNLAVSIGSDLPYAAIHEFGGYAGRRGPFKKKNGRRAYIPARPYLRPTISHLEQILPDLLDQAIQQLEGSNDLFS
jgi:phage gpG-like protein